MMVDRDLPYQDSQDSETPANELPPRLRQVLAGIDVHLEAELARYRRQKRRQPTAASPIIDRQHRPELISIQSQSAPHSDMPVEPQPEPQAAQQSESGRPKPNAPPPPPFKPRCTAQADTAATSRTGRAAAANQQPLPEDYLASSEELLKSLDEQPFPDTQTWRQKVRQRAISWQTHPLLQHLPQQIWERVGHRLSQPLSRSFPSRVSTAVSRRWQIYFPQLATPVGLSLFVLLAGGSVGLAYWLASPRPSQTGQPPVQSTTTVSNPDSDLSASTVFESYRPPGPDLSSREFVDLNLESLSTLNLRPDPTAAQAVPEASAVMTEPLPPLPSPRTNPSEPNLGSNYYVTLEFTGEQSLLDARQFIDEAFVRSFADGNRIQLGAFTSQVAAQQWAEQMQQRGLPAQLYGPTSE